MKFNKQIIMWDMIFPSFVFLLLMIIFHYSFLDTAVASHFFDSVQGWIYRDNVILENYFHKGGVKLTISLIVVLIGFTLYSYVSRKKKLYRFLIFVLGSSLLSIFLIFILKKYSTFPCPWSSRYFGGQIETLSFFSLFSSAHSREHCFPAGHSSGGYAFISLYYGYCFIYRKRKFELLIPALVLGGIFGLTQQARGAHFMSHDFATIVISILSSWMTYIVLNYYNKLYEI